MKHRASIGFPVIEARFLPDTIDYTYKMTVADYANLSVLQLLTIVYSQL
jgi:hypothetical protein